MLEAVRSRIEDKENRCCLAGDEPVSAFDHRGEFFPADVYAKIQEYNPFLRNQGKEWMDKKVSAQASSRTPYYARKQINFHENDLFEAPPEQQEFWKKLQRIFMTDNWFEKTVMRKYPDFFRLRFGDLVDEPDFFPLFKRGDVPATP